MWKFFKPLNGSSHSHILHGMIGIEMPRLLREKSFMFINSLLSTQWFCDVKKKKHSYNPPTAVLPHPLTAWAAFFSRAQYKPDSPKAGHLYSALKEQ